MENLETMHPAELVALAMSRGLKVRGKSREEVLRLLQPDVQTTTVAEDVEVDGPMEDAKEEVLDEIEKVVDEIAKPEAPIGTTRSGTEKIDETQLLMDLMVRINKLEQRIDRLVEAIDKSKRVKGI